MIPRKAHKSDKEDVLSHFVNDMTGEFRRLRFGYQAKDDAVAKYLDRSWENLGSNDEQWFVVKDKDRIVGTCHAVFMNDTHVELGFTVAPDYQGNGIGQKLFERGTNWSRSKGAEAIFMQCLSENEVIQHIASKNGMKTVTLAPGEKEAVRELTKSELIASHQEVIHDTLAIYDAVIREHGWMMEKFFKMICRVKN